MNDLNLKPHFFEMIIEEPVLQEKIAKKYKSATDTIVEMAREKCAILALPEISEIIAEHYNTTMPEHLKITAGDCLNQVQKSSYLKSFKKLQTVQ